MKPSPLRNTFRLAHRRVDQIAARLAGSRPLGQEAAAHRQPISLAGFAGFTSARHSHFERFIIPPAYRSLHRRFCDLKTYQDLFAYTLIRDVIPAGARLLEIGGGTSRVIPLLEDHYEVWNLDKMEGAGHGPVAAPAAVQPRLVRDYIGAFNPQFDDHSFDCVFSISTLEHVPEDDQVFANIVADIRRLLKPGGISFHTIDIVLKGDSYWPHRFIDYLYANGVPANPRLSPAEILSDPDLWTLSPYAYYSHWFGRTRQRYGSFGRPTGCQVWWRV